MTAISNTPGKRKLKTTMTPVARYVRLQGSTSSFLHGVETTETTVGTSTVIEVASCIIGITGTAEIAAANQLLVVRSMDEVESKVGAGSIYDALYRIYNNYVSSQIVICLPLGKASDFADTSLPTSGVSGSSAAVTLYDTSDITSPVWSLYNPHNLPLTYLSSDETVLTIDSDGTPVPVADGSATMTITVDGGTKYTSDVITVDFTVAADDDIPEGMTPSRAAFSASQLTMYIAQPGSPVTLTNPDNQTVSWSGSDNTVATVDATTGAVTPESAGSMMLTATLAATSTVMACTVTCKITVQAAPANPLLAAFIDNISLFRKSRQLFGYGPKLMLAPDILNQDGAQGPASSLGTQIRAVWFGDLPQGMTSVEEATAWKTTNCVYPRVFMDWPRVSVLDDSGATVWGWVAPSMIGLCCQLDKGLTGSEFETGYWCSPSNYVLPDVLGVEQTLEYIPNDASCEVNTLNSQGIATVINQLGGWRAFGNRSTAFPDTTDATSFIAWRRVCDVVEDSIEYFTLQYLDKPMFTRPTDISTSLIGIIQESVNGFLRSKIGTALVYGRCFINASDNTLESLQQGIIKYRYQITPPVPMEHVEYTSEVYIAGLELAFRQLIGG